MYKYYSVAFLIGSGKGKKKLKLKKKPSVKGNGRKTSRQVSKVVRDSYSRVKNFPAKKLGFRGIPRIDWGQQSGKWDMGEE